MSENLDLVRSIYADWERGDFTRTAWAHPEIEFVSVSSLETYRTTGHDYRRLDEERILVFVAHTGRGRSSGLEVADLGDLGQPAALFHLRDGRVTRLVVYTSRERAFSDLGLEG